MGRPSPRPNQWASQIHPRADQIRGHSKSIISRADKSKADQINGRPNSRADQVYRSGYVMGSGYARLGCGVKIISLLFVCQIIFFLKEQHRRSPVV